MSKKGWNTQSGLGAIVDQLKKDLGLSKKYSAIVEGIGNKDKPGQVQLRVAGVHPTSKKTLPSESLPWQKVVQTVGSGGGIGDSINLQVGQWVEVEAATPGASSWKVIRNIPAVPSSDKGDDAYGQVAEGDDDKLTSEIEPILGSGDITKLAATAWGLVNSGLLSSFVGDGPPPAESSPPIPVGNWVITTPILDWTADQTKEVSKDGKNLGNLRDLITIGADPLAIPPLLGHRPGDDVRIELIPAVSGYPGDVMGWDTDSNPLYIRLENDAIIVPRLILKPGDSPITVTIDYKATRMDNSTTPPTEFQPVNESQGSISFTVVFEPTVVVAVQGVSTYDVGDSTKSLLLEEDPDTAEKTEPAKAKIWQSPDGLISERKDFTEGNVSWGTTIMTEKGNNETLSRINMGPTGITTVKSASDMVLISKKNLQMYIENEVEQTIKTMMTIHCPVTKIKGDVRIEGNFHVIGNITHTGTQTTSDDVIANGISLVNHTHSQGKDSDGNTQVPTDPPS